MKQITWSFIVILLPVMAFAQAPAASTEPRFVVIAGTGFGTAWDDEGLLGRGPGISFAAGMRLGPRLMVLGLVDRVAYYRDVEWLTFDGRIVFTGAELSLQSAEGRTRPHVTFGAGALNDAGTWIRKSQGPIESRIDERIDRAGTHAAMTVSGGLDVRVSPRVALRGGLRFYGLLDTGDDLFPHVVIQPTVSVILRF